MELSGLIGYFMGFVLGNLILGSLLAGLVFLIAKIAGKSWRMFGDWDTFSAVDAPQGSGPFVIRTEPRGVMTRRSSSSPSRMRQKLLVSRTHRSSV